MFKTLTGNIFGLILKNKMAATGVLRLSARKFCWPCRTKGIIGRDLRFTGYVQNLDWKYFWPHFEKQDGCHGRSFQS